MFYKQTIISIINVMFLLKHTLFIYLFSIFILFLYDVLFIFWLIVSLFFQFGHPTISRKYSSAIIGTSAICGFLWLFVVLPSCRVSVWRCVLGAFRQMPSRQMTRSLKKYLELDIRDGFWKQSLRMCHISGGVMQSKERKRFIKIM